MKVKKVELLYSDKKEKEEIFHSESFFLQENIFGTDLFLDLSAYFEETVDAIVVIETGKNTRFFLSG